MKRVLFFLFIMTTATVSAQLSSADQKEVAGKVEALRLALVDANAGTLEELLADKLSYGHSGGKVEGKESLINSLTSGESDFLDITISDLSVDVVGDVALVRHKLMANTQDKGKDKAKVSLSILLVWHRINNQWKLLARQAVKI